MDWTIKLEARTGWGDVETIEVARLGRRVVGLAPEEVGLSLAEAKGVLAELQRLVLQTQTVATISYQRRGSGCKPAVAWADLDLVPDPRAWLEQRLGPIAWCDIEPPKGPETDPPPPEPPPPRPSRKPPKPVAETESQAPPAAEADDLAEELEAEDLPLAVVDAPPPALRRLLAARAGGWPAEVRVVVLDPVASEPAPVVKVASYVAAAEVAAMMPFGPDG